MLVNIQDVVDKSFDYIIVGELNSHASVPFAVDDSYVLGGGVGTQALVVISY